MHVFLQIIFAILVSLCADEAVSADPQIIPSNLAKLDRSIGKLPAFRSEQPLYSLLVFGPMASKHVWLVRDGDVLYVDRNGNGDLTEEGERIEPDSKLSKSEDGLFEFRAGSIFDRGLEHKNLTVSWHKLNHLEDKDPRVKSVLSRDPQWRLCLISIDAEMIGQYGAGVGGRVTQSISWQDKHGLPEFGVSPEKAPIMHFEGPLQIGFYSREPWEVGRSAKPSLAVGTPGIGLGSTVFTDYEGVISLGRDPELFVTFPSVSEGQSSLTKSYTLTDRCCGCNLYGSIDVPADIGTGRARVEVSLPNGSGAPIASTIDEIEILPAKASPQLEPISKRLKTSLELQPRKAVVAIQFSPDGKRLAAGSYPGGVVKIWNTENGNRLATIEVGKGLRSTHNYFAVAPDWQTIVAPTNGKGRKYERIEKDGKLLYRWSFDDSVRVFDANTGELLQTFKHTPPREINLLSFVPNSDDFITQDGIPGEYESGYKRAATLWNGHTGKYHDLPSSESSSLLYSSDGKQIAMAKWSLEDNKYELVIKLLDRNLPEQETQIRLPAGPIHVSPCFFLEQGSLLAGSIFVYDKPDDYRHFQSTLKFWETASGKEVASIPTSEANGAFSPILSPDEHTIITAPSDRLTKRCAINVINVADYSVRVVGSWDNMQSSVKAFHPSSKWVVVATYTPQISDEELPAEDLSQPRLHIVDIEQAKIVETLITPQAYLNSMAFSPDGKTLATSGNGEVLLWDFQDLNSNATSK